MSIGAVASIASSTVTIPTSRPETDAHGTNQRDSPPPADRPPAIGAEPDAAVTTLSDAARAQQAADDAQAARDAAAAASASAAASAVYRDWAAGAPAVDDGAIKDALDALDEASRENLRAAAGAFTAQRDRAAWQQAAVDDAAALAEQQRDAAVLAAINAEIRLAYGGLPSPLTGDPALREPGQVEVIA